MNMKLVLKRSGLKEAESQSDLVPAIIEAKHLLVIVLEGRFYSLEQIGNTKPIHYHCTEVTCYIFNISNCCKAVNSLRFQKMFHK